MYYGRGGENQAENVEVKIYLLKKGCYSKKKLKVEHLNVKISEWSVKDHRLRLSIQFFIKGRGGYQFSNVDNRLKGIKFLSHGWTRSRFFVNVARFSEDKYPILLPSPLLFLFLLPLPM